MTLTQACQIEVKKKKKKEKKEKKKKNKNPLFKVPLSWLIGLLYRLYMHIESNVIYASIRFIEAY